MKVKIISFVLILLMVASIFPVSVTAATHSSGVMAASILPVSPITATYSSGIMCSDYATHSQQTVLLGTSRVSAIYACYGCPSPTYVCRICYPDHVHVSSSYCSVHSKFYQFCITCEGYHCPSSGHGHSSYAYYYCDYHPTVAYTYCSYCGTYYCSSCYSGYHSHSHYQGIGASSPFYCTNHSTYVLSTYCTICQIYYCASCYGSYHNHNYYYGGDLSNSYFVCRKHTVDVGATQCNYCGYYYCATCYGGYHAHASSTPLVTTCESPRANITNGSSVEYGTRVTLSTDTANAYIYYTVDGTTPTANSARYTGAITLTKNTTLKAIAIKSGAVNSSVSTYKYTIKTKVNFNDISDYPGLSASLSVLVDAKVYIDGTAFNPSKSFTFGELESWLAAINVSFKDVTDIDHFDDEDELSYNDFVYVLYKVLRKADLISAPKTAGYTTLKKFTYSQDITNTSFYKAGFVSFYENGLFYDVNFKPNDLATRAYLATAIAAVVENNDL